MAIITLKENPYTTLGLKLGFTEKDLEKAHRAHLIKWHSDKYQHLGRQAAAQADEKRKQGDAAYNVLKDFDKIEEKMHWDQQQRIVESGNGNARGNSYYGNSRQSTYQEPDEEDIFAAFRKAQRESSYHSQRSQEDRWYEEVRRMYQRGDDFFVLKTAVGSNYIEAVNAYTCYATTIGGYTFLRKMMCFGFKFVNSVEMAETFFQQADSRFKKEMLAVGDFVVFDNAFIAGNIDLMKKMGEFVWDAGGETLMESMLLAKSCHQEALRRSRLYSSRHSSKEAIQWCQILNESRKIVKKNPQLLTQTISILGHPDFTYSLRDLNDWFSQELMKDAAKRAAEVKKQEEAAREAKRAQAQQEAERNQVFAYVEDMYYRKDYWPLAEAVTKNDFTKLDEIFSHAKNFESKDWNRRGFVETLFAQGFQHVGNRDGADRFFRLADTVSTFIATDNQKLKKDMLASGDFRVFGEAIRHGRDLLMNDILAKVIKVGGSVFLKQMLSANDCHSAAISQAYETFRKRTPGGMSTSGLSCHLGLTLLTDILYGKRVLIENNPYIFHKVAGILGENEFPSLRRLREYLRISSKEKRESRFASNDFWNKDYNWKDPRGGGFGR